MSARKDGQLLKRVQQTLASLATVGDCDLDLNVSDGTVEIAGTVPTGARRAEILEVLRKVEGVQDVEADIHVLREADHAGMDLGIFHEEPQSETRAEEMMEEDPRFLSEGEESYQ